MMRTLRRPNPGEPHQVVLLRFTDGKIVNPANCPRGIQAHTHWRFDPQATGETNTVCACTPPPIAVEDLV